MQPSEPKTSPLSCNRSYLLALIVSLFLSHQSYVAEQRDQSVDPVIAVFCLSLISAALGVNVPPDLFGRIGDKL